jgi:hypothetical protein
MVTLRLILSLFVFSIFTVFALPAESIFRSDEYRVYEAVLAECSLGFGQKTHLIRDRTALAVDDYDREEEFLYIQNAFAGLRQETLSDFKAKSLNSYPIKPYMLGNYQYRLIGHNEIVELFRYKDGFSRFKHRYPEAEGLITFSRVGFNRYKSQALLCVSSQWGDFSGAGVYFLLDKDDLGLWKVTQRQRVWHSWLPEEEDSSPGAFLQEQNIF